MKKINKYFKGVGEEVHRIRWPNRRELWPSVGVVVSVTVVAAIGLLLCDFISTEILRAFEIAFNGGSSSSSSAAAAILKLGGLL